MKSDAGYTLLETTIAVTLAVFAFVLVAGVYLFGQRQFQAYHERTRLENAAQLIGRAVSNDLYQSDGNVLREGDGIVIVSAAGRPIRYDIEAGVLFRNAHTLADGRIVTEAFQVSKYVDERESGSSTRENLFEVTFHIRGRQSLISTRVIASRRPREWAAFDPTGDG